MIKKVLTVLILLTCLAGCGLGSGEVEYEGKYYFTSGKTDYRIIVDINTGVNYILRDRDYGGGITPLLDKKGNVVITQIPSEVKDD